MDEKRLKGTLEVEKINFMKDFFGIVWQFQIKVIHLHPQTEMRRTLSSVGRATDS